MKPKHQRKKYQAERSSLPPLSEEDKKRVRALSDEVDILVELGGWTIDEFDRVLLEFLKIVNGKSHHGVGFIYEHSDPEWFDEFESRQSDRLKAEADELIQAGSDSET